MISGQKTEEKQKNKKISKKVLTKVETRGKLYIVVAQDKRTTDKRERLREA
jgi:hypothetical protein